MKNTVINTALVLTSIVLAIFVSELVLAALNFEPAYNVKINTRETPNTPRPGVIRQECLANSLEDIIEQGMSSIRGNIKPDKDLGHTYNRETQASLNPENFYHKHRNHIRILVLGDSFTDGFNADPGKGYVDLLSRYYQDKGVGFFNTGTPGYAQNNQLAVLEKYTDLVKPHLVLLGFLPANDMMDNLTPLDRFTVLPASGNVGLTAGVWVYNYEVITADGHVSVRRRSSDEVLRLYRWMIGCDNPTPTRSRSVKEFLREEVIYRSRVGTRMYYLLYKWKHFFDPVVRRHGREIEDEEVIVTGDYLLRMKKFLEVRNIPFYVLLIPVPVQPSGRFETTEYYDKGIRLLQKHSIPYTDPFETLSLEDYTFAPHDRHWNNSGHSKVYELIKSYFGDDLEVHLRNSDEYR